MLCHNVHFAHACIYTYRMYNDNYINLTTRLIKFTLLIIIVISLGRVGELEGKTNFK